MSEAYIIRRGGGASLNYKVVGSTTEPTKKENTIWVNTSTAITSHVFSATEPTSPAAGMVWFKVSTASPAPFNMLKKNTAMIYPVGCKQYIGGAWSSLEAEICKNNTWIPWVYFLFRNNTINETYTGGIYGTQKNNALYYSVSSMAAADNDTFTTKSKIDLTNVKSVHVKYMSPNTTSSIYLRLLAIDTACDGVKKLPVVLRLIKK